MTIAPDTLIEMKKFFRKLSSAIEQQASFSFMNTRWVNKTRIDDILCCIEANFPEELKKRKTLKSMQFYKELLRIIKHKCFFSSAYYSINYSEALKLIDFVLTNFRRDLEYLNNISQDMF